MFKVKNWKMYQHYKKRNPPWIKLHRSTLDDLDFLKLPIASRALAPYLWLLASESPDGSITLSNKDLALRLRLPLDEVVDGINPLISKGFLVSLAQESLNASNSLATQSSRDRDRDREETEAEGPLVPDSQEDKSKLVDAIGHTYPGNRTLKGKSLPNAHEVAILGALLVDGNEVLKGTKAFAEAVKKWPAHRRQFIPSADRWYREAKYLTDPAEWVEVKPGEEPAKVIPRQSGMSTMERVWKEHAEMVAEGAGTK